VGILKSDFKYLPTKSIPIHFIRVIETKFNNSINTSARFLCTSSKQPDGVSSVGTSKSSGEKEAKESKTRQSVEDKEAKELLELDDYDDYEEPKTAGQKVAAYSILGFRLFLIFGGLVCIGILVVELMPTRLSPNSLFNEAFNVVRENEEIISLIGEEMRAFGRDVGRNTEGRRNHVDSRSYKDEDGSKRARVRFHVKGPKGRVAVYAEVSNRSPSKEFVYLICQDSRTGRVITIEDNRARIALEASAPSSEARDAMNALMGSFAKK